MSMIDPITRLPTPLNYLGGRPVLSGFPVGGLGVPGPSSLPGGPGSSLVHVPGLGYGTPAAGPMGGVAAAAEPLVGASSYGFSPASQAARAATRSTLPGPLGMAGRWGGAARGLAPLAGSMAANALFGQESPDDSVLREAGRGFVKGASWAPAVAPFVAGMGPLAPAGGALLAGTAAVTGVIGAAADVFDLGAKLGFGGGKKKVDPTVILTAAIQAANIDPQIAAQIQSTYDTSMQLAGMFDPSTKEDDQRAAFEAAKSQIIASANSAQSAAQQQSAAPDLLALQAMSQSIFAPITSGIEQSGADYANAMKGIRGSLPAEFQGMADAQVARHSAFSSQLANAYRAQAAMTPVMARMTQYQQDQQSFANQMWQQQQAQAMSGAGGAGEQAADVTAMLQQVI